MLYAHKTFSGMIRAAENLTAELIANPPDCQVEADAMSRKVGALLNELSSLWSNPADQHDADVARCNLLEAWHVATN